MFTLLFIFIIIIIIDLFLAVRFWAGILVVAYSSKYPVQVA